MNPLILYVFFCGLMSILVIPWQLEEAEEDERV